MYKLYIYIICIYIIFKRALNLFDVHKKLRKKKFAIIYNTKEKHLQLLLCIKYVTHTEIKIESF